VGIAFIGAGAFARGTLLPLLSGRQGLSLERVVTAHGLTAFDAQRKFGFHAVGTDAGEVLSDDRVGLVFIATRHDAHATLVAAALSAGKHVFVEKPLALNEEQLVEVERAAASSPGLLLVGFNRRFAPMTVALRAALQGRGPITMTCRVNAGALPPGHWLNDPASGGGRIIGEGCHFIDLLSSLTGDAAITSVQAISAGRPRGPAEDVVIQIGFEDGSVGQILYTAKGDPSFGKERLEAHAGGASGLIDDFRSGTLRRGGKSQSLGAAGKGHREEIDALLAAVRGERAVPIALATMAAVTRATFRVHAAIAEGS
jgi:polar amino acid transport system substrate-binding protein